MKITIYHNPRCGTSRKVLAAIEERGFQPRIVDYLKTPPARDELVGLLAAMGLGPREILRRKEPLYAELGLDDPARSDAEILDAIGAHPVLMERPVVETPKGVRLCRPAEKVEEIL